MVSTAFNSVCARNQPMRIEGHVIAREAIFDPQSSASMAVGMRMLLVMLPEQVLAVVVPVRSPDDRVDVFPIHFSRIGGEAAKAHRFVVPLLGGSVGRRSIPFRPNASA